MRAVFVPSRASGTVSAPPSKSFAHRYLIGAALAGGESRIGGIVPSDDMRATINCLRSFGAEIAVTESGDAVVRGTGGIPQAPDCPLPCGESGSTLRFLIPLAMCRDGKTVFTGSARLFSRPLGVYETIAAEHGLTFSRSETALTIGGRLRGGDFAVSGAESSQFVTGLLFALPLLKEDSTLSVLPPVTSAPYIGMTLSVLKESGIRIGQNGEHSFFIPGNQTYRPASFTVEGDWSNAAALLTLGPDVTVAGLRPDSLQGDKVIVRHLEAIGNGIPTLDLSDCPDLGPVLFAAAALSRGARFLHTERLRLKECDRIAAMTAELGKCGIAAETDRDALFIPGGRLTAPQVPLSSHHDHRIAMALSVILSRTGGELTEAEAVNKSFPGWFDALRALKIGFDLIP